MRLHVRPPARGGLAAAGLLLGTLLVGGCAVTTRTREAPVGTLVGANTFKRIQPGETTVGWLLAVLGEPDAVAPDGADPLAGDAARMSWTGGRRSVGGGSVLIIPGKTASDDLVRTTVEVSGGRVLSVHRESADRRLDRDEARAFRDTFRDRDGG